MPIEAPTSGRVLDFLAGGGALLGGTSVVLVACTLLGLAVWGAIRPPSSLPMVLARWMAGGAGTFALWIGLVLASAATEALLDRPLGRYGGAPALAAWWLAFRVGAWDAAITATLARRLDPGDSPLHTALAGWAWAVAAGTLVCSFLAAGGILIVAIGALLEMLI